MKVVCPYCRGEYDMDNYSINSNVQCEACGQCFTVGCDRLCSCYGGAALLFRATALFMVVADGMHGQYLTPWMWCLCCVLVILGFVYNIAYLVRRHEKRASTAGLLRLKVYAFVDTILFGAISIVVLLVALSKILELE